MWHFYWNNKERNLFTFTDIILTIVAIMALINYKFTGEMLPMYGIIVLCYVSIVMFLNRQFHFPDFINVALYVPFLIAAIYFTYEVFKRGTKF
jgi:hypothetical protein